MNLRVIFSLILLTVIMANAEKGQEIALHGTVNNVKGEKVGGAKVKLLVAGLTVTTDDSGKYSLLRTGIDVARLSVPKTENILLNNGVLEIRLASSSPVKVEIFDIKGTLLKKELHQKASAGVYRLNIFENAFASKVLIIKALVEGHLRALRYTPVSNDLNMVHSSMKSAGTGNGSLTKVAATEIEDTLMTVAEGYDTSKVPITSYNQEVNVTLKTVNKVCGTAYFTDFPAGKTPREIGERIAKLFNSSYSPATMSTDVNDEYAVPFHYKAVCTWYGALDLANLTDNKSLLETLIKKYTDNSAAYDRKFNAIKSGSGSVDANILGMVPLEVYLLDSNEKALTAGTLIADHQIANKDAANQKRYAADDMFMVTGLQVQAYRATRNSKYIDFMAERMVDYLDTMQDGKDGCFPQKIGVSAKWGRANGWFAVGMAEMLRVLDPSHKNYARILDGYKKMMAGLLEYQIQDGQQGAGIWRQVIERTDSSNWPETSGSAMFATAMITGVKMCILDEQTYGPAARKAWLALTNYVGQDGKVSQISDWCYYSSGDAYSYYVGRPKVTGDGHGQAPMLWAAAALLR
jgi:rhamnogalacturonyl hydrolase YesR